MNNTANTDQFDAWNGENGERWVANADRHDRVFTPVADALFDAVRLREGEHVLDVGCGCGATTLRAAQTIGNLGTAVGLDISRPILDVARTRAATAAIRNVTFVHGDAEDHEFAEAAIDVMIARFGTMFFSDPTAAFINIAGAIRRGGRIAFATWKPLVDNEWLLVPGAALLQHAAMPIGDPNAPGMFAQSDPSIITATLADAGFTDINCRSLRIDLTFGRTIDDAVEHLADSGPGRAMLATIPAGPAFDAALDDVRTALGDHLASDGVHLHGGIWITTATRDA